LSLKTSRSSYTWSFERIGKLANPLTKLIKRREKRSISKYRNEKRDIITNNHENKRTITEYFKNLYSNYLEEIGNYQDAY
jgi:cytolysin (calcineurin-like family phosphatase)